ncbi:MAG: hypothetical protein IV086_05455 [Hyphomonadaceae bacterium]|nr:MAG: hypothetical protein FD160_112 [Caulobacteraceae bacterium]MBT9445125.1 hypothetical protein [Hyphomonadaceae bacterium]TPW08449.1 MAG: hypothetical protein FD124_413 [Alphaproteobacteria bacterium]
MTSTEEPPPVAEMHVVPPDPEPRNLVQWIGQLGRIVSRLWVVGLLIGAAMGSGVALNQMFQAEARLEAMRQEPGPDAYAVVAYRRELARQIEAYRRVRTADAVPQPPARPRLLEEIDIARRRNQGVTQGGSGSAPPRTMPVVNAPN